MRLRFVKPRPELPFSIPHLGVADTTKDNVPHAGRVSDVQPHVSTSPDASSTRKLASDARTGLLTGQRRLAWPPATPVLSRLMLYGGGCVRWHPLPPLGDRSIGWAP